jgi:hypothetical protein
MNEQLQKLALIAEIVGGLAVFVSVIYLAMQISDNSRLLRSQSHYNALELAQEPLRMMVEDGDLAELILECDESLDQVSPGQRSRCENYYFIQYNSWEYLYYQNGDESIPSHIWVGADAYYRDELKTKDAYGKFWSSYKIAFDDPFKSYVNDLVESL